MVSDHLEAEANFPIFHLFLRLPKDVYENIFPLGDASKYAHLVFKCIDRGETGNGKYWNLCYSVILHNSSLFIIYLQLCLFLGLTSPCNFVTITNYTKL